MFSAPLDIARELLGFSLKDNHTAVGLCVSKNLLAGTYTVLDNGISAMRITFAPKKQLHIVTPKNTFSGSWDLVHIGIFDNQKEKNDYDTEMAAYLKDKEDNSRPIPPYKQILKIKYNDQEIYLRIILKMHSIIGLVKFTPPSETPFSWNEKFNHCTFITRDNYTAPFKVCVTLCCFITFFVFIAAELLKPSLSNMLIRVGFGPEIALWTGSVLYYMLLPIFS